MKHLRHSEKGGALAVLLPRLLWMLLLLAPTTAPAEERFPPPDFDSGYSLPAMEQPAMRLVPGPVLDVAVLGVALTAAAWLALRRRSRRGIVLLSVFSLAWFGFLRAGCFCPVGSLQNIALAIGDSTYAPPAALVVFFTLPLVFSLFCGRVFCSGVCPLGALQDLVLFRPLRLPGWLDRGLRPLPWFYLGLAVLYAWAGSGFVVCRFDPFVQVFRLTGSLPMLAFAAAVLGLCAFVGRAYCRYACPYGVLLGLFSSFARRRVSITPDKCVRCGLCADACPFGAIEPADPELRQ